jgi:transposase-like protein
MDDTLAEFLQAAELENRHRHTRRRYSRELQQRAVEYWQQRKAHERFRTIAAAFGVSPTTLQRWTRASRQPRFRRIEVMAAAPRAETAPVVVVITAAGPRIEGLTVESAARLLTLLR